MLEQDWRKNPTSWPDRAPLPSLRPRKLALAVEWAAVWVEVL